MTYIPDLDYIQKTANFLTISETVVPKSGEIPADYAQQILDQNTEYVQQQFAYFGLSLPTDTNNIAVLPARNLIAYRTIVDLMDSYLNDSERTQYWREKVARTETEFKEACQYYTAQKSTSSITAGVVGAPRVNTRA